MKDIVQGPERNPGMWDWVLIQLLRESILRDKSEKDKAFTMDFGWNNFTKIENMKIPVLDYSQNTKYNPFSLLPNKLSIHNSCIFEKGSIYLSSMTPSPALGHQQGCVVCTLNVRSLQVVLASEIFENIFCHIKDAPSSTLNVFFWFRQRMLHRKMRGKYKCHSNKYFVRRVVRNCSSQYLL